MRRKLKTAADHEILQKEWYLYRVRDTGSDDLTCAHHDYFELLKEMNSELIRLLADSITRSIQSEIDDTFEIVIDKYKGKLIESLLEIGFIKSLEEIESELPKKDDPFIEKPETTYLYIIEGKESQKIKIGIAKNIDSRISNLQTANPEELDVINKIEFPYRSEALEAEKLLHEYFKDFRIFPKGKSTEWFKHEVRDYTVGLTREHIPQIQKTVDKRKHKKEEAMQSIHIFKGENK